VAGVQGGVIRAAKAGDAGCGSGAAHPVSPQANTKANKVFIQLKQGGGT
jgi:hypothetical protein